MKDENIDIIEHKILYKNDNKNEYAKDCNSYEIALNYFYKNNPPDAVPRGYFYYVISFEIWLAAPYRDLWLFDSQK